jgi:DeoR family fructose operon transcriptional repressor
VLNPWPIEMPLVPMNATSARSAESAATRSSPTAAWVVVLADSSKFGVETTVRFAALDDVDVVITDSGADERDVKALRDAGLDVVVA